MNNPTFLTAAGLILALATSALLVYYLRLKNRSRAFFSKLAAPFLPAKPPAVNPAASEKIQDPPASNPKAVPNSDLDRRWLIVAMFFLGFLFEILSLYLRKDLLLGKNYWAYAPFLAFGILLFAGGVYTASRLELRVFFDPALEWMALKMEIRPAQCVCLLAGILLAALATVAAGTNAKMISPAVAIASWIAGIAVTILGGWRFDPSTGRTRLPRSAWVWAILLTLFAFLLRAVLIGQIPRVLAGDEGATGFDALLILTGKANNPFGVFGRTPYPFLYFYIEAVGIAALGRTIEAVRIFSALAGALTVGGVYFLGRGMYSHRHGLAAAIFLSALHLHMEFSRQALEIIWDGLFYLITLGALWYGWKTGRRSFWILAGLAFGIGQYFYYTDRTLVATVPLFLIAATIIDRPGWRRNLKNLLPALASLAAALLPLAWFMHIHPYQFFGHQDAVSIFGSWMTNAVREQGLPVWRILIKQFELGFGAFFTVNLSWWYHPDAPILRTLPAVFFVSGLAILALRLRDTRTWILLLWMAAFGAVVSLSESTPAAQRLPGVAAACALVVGLGVVESASILAKLLPAHKRLLGAAVILLVGYMAADDLRFYFFQYTPESGFQGRYDNVGAGDAVSSDIVNSMKDQPGQWEVVFFPKNFGFFTSPALGFLLPNVNGIDIPHPWGSPDNPAIPGGNLFFAFMSGREDDISRVQADYPGDQLRTVLAPNGTVLYSYYRYKPGP